MKIKLTYLLTLWLILITIYIGFEIYDRFNISCDIKDGELYYSPNCPYCQKQLSEGSIEKLKKEFGIKIIEHDVIEENISVPSVPAWVINNQVTYGYQTYEQLLRLFECD